MQPVFNALARHAQDRPDATAFTGNGESMSWAELAARVAALAQTLEGAPACIAIGHSGGCAYVVADLALTLTGRRQVPLPFFFSADQITHVIRDSGAQAIITDHPAGFAPLPIIRADADVPTRPSAFIPAGGSERIIYTSGSSGTPKGVVIGEQQLMASLSGLQPLVGATRKDRHLSILPLAQLLEQICGIYLPILAGAETRFDFAATRALFGTETSTVTEAFERERPTTSLLVPGLLGRWVADLQRRGQQAPDSLRFVAVGGAASAPALLHQAWATGVPVHEGYGLSECCAVVAMNRPGANRIGTAGEILDGLDVVILDGEITVSGPTVMSRYLNAPPPPLRWHTGDLGRIEEGRLIVEGRKDAVLVSPNGRNISPEWVEQRVNADPRVVASALGLREDGELVIVVAATAPVALPEIASLLADLPAYARPTGAVLTSPHEPGLLFPAGTPDRTVAARIINSRDAAKLPPQRESLAS
ncbi:AMP-binding protein [Phycobacter sp. K97]|uniref:AMP-binding protein n=1 Tax=Phycobacter sedimenti TaxID=3133977 RepID=UPI00311F1939